jgi:putative membrane protein
MWRRGYGLEPGAILALGLMWLVLAGVLVALVVVFLGRRGRRPATGVGDGGTAVGAGYGAGPAQGVSGPGPLAILDERLARGEIDVDAYRAVRAELTQSPPPPKTSPPTQASG